MTADEREVESFRAKQARRWYALFSLSIAICVGAYFGVAALWSFAAGLGAALLLAVVTYEALRRWNRESWKRRFPELRDREFKWIVRS
jgi:membrane protein implicated in regulation of membrane protease activity